MPTLKEEYAKMGDHVKEIVIGGGRDFADEWLDTHGDCEVKGWRFIDATETIVEVDLVESSEPSEELESYFKKEIEKDLQNQIHDYGYIDAQIIQRFNFEPGARAHRWSTDRWIKVYDRFKHKYVKNGRANVTFADFAQALEWLRKRYTGEISTEMSIPKIEFLCYKPSHKEYTKRIYSVAKIVWGMENGSFYTTDLQKLKDWINESGWAEEFKGGHCNLEFFVNHARFKSI